MNIGARARHGSPESEFSSDLCPPLFLILEQMSPADGGAQETDGGSVSLSRGVRRSGTCG